MDRLQREEKIPDGRTTAIIERVRTAVADWKTHAKAANVAPALIRDIDASLNTPGDGGGGVGARAAYSAWRSGRGR